jgi:glyoxylase-like metal-dependent hydrolase (beta-lactamase superfamily II)
MHTPGHSPGGISLYHEPSATAIVGDTLFAGSVGRTDFPGSDPRVLTRSIREKLYTLPEATKIYPGHGPTSSIGREKRSNPFVRP